uniref:Uncharacterized protein n=1 Tax=Romanomermis culicivorax TaxID=13658 RepID=A0A915K866_ROMCU
NLIQLEQNDTFDLCYVDADKFNYKVYFEQCYKLVRPLGLMAFDNVLWSGYVANNDPRIRNNLLVDNFRKFNKKLAQDPRVWSQLIAVGDGLAIVFDVPNNVCHYFQKKEDIVHDNVEDFYQINTQNSVSYFKNIVGMFGYQFLITFDRYDMAIAHHLVDSRNDVDQFVPTHFEIYLTIAVGIERLKHKFRVLPWI